MSRVFAANTDHLDSSSTIITDVPMTISALVKYSAISGIKQIGGIGVVGAQNNSLNIIYSSAAFIAQEYDTNASNAQTTMLLPAGDTTTWRLIVGVFTTHSSRSVFMDGTGKITSSSVKTASGMNAIRLSGTFNTTPVDFHIGKMAHVAMWNIALSDAQVNSLLYLYPNQVSVANLVNYWPLTGNQSPEPDYGSGNLPLTVTGTTFSTDNPNIAGTQVIQLMGGSAS